MLEYDKIIYDSIKQLKRIEKSSQSVKKNYLENSENLNIILHD